METSEDLLLDWVLAVQVASVSRVSTVATAVAAFLLLAPTIAGCSSGFTVSTGPAPATLSGTLRGVGGDGSGCAWVEEATGRRVEVFWPDRWSVEFDPVAVFDSAGRQVAIAGDMLAIEGFFNEVGGSVCNVATTFSARQVQVAEPSPTQ